jgi:hypothetical protein
VLWLFTGEQPFSANHTLIKGRHEILKVNDLVAGLIVSLQPPVERKETLIDSRLSIRSEKLDRAKLKNAAKAYG